MLLSVIIPVYKVADTIGKCIESVLSQGISDMEVILVDDGSPDDCPAICDGWATKDSRIRVLHKANGGLSDARNTGLDVARGEYITFVDSDDWLEADTYKPLLGWLQGHENIDILEFSLRHIGGNRQEVTFKDRIFPSAKQYWEATMAWRHAYAWNKIYKRWLFDGIRFPTGKTFEDVYTLPRLLTLKPKIATSSHGTYCYVWNKNGIAVTAEKNGKGFHHHLEALRIAAKLMGTGLLSHNGPHLYYSMLCRQIGLYRQTGEIILPWPFIGLVCRLHEKIKGQEHENTVVR